MPELIAYAKKIPGKVNFASPGHGTPPHMVGEMFKQRAGIDIVHIPYKGTAAALTDIMGGQVEMTFENPSVIIPLVQAGKLKALGVTGEARNPHIPDVPTMIEGGLPDFVSMSFTGLVAPAGTPPAIVERLNAEINAGPIPRTADVRQARRRCTRRRTISPPSSREKQNGRRWRKPPTSGPGDMPAAPSSQRPIAGARPPCLPPPAQTYPDRLDPPDRAVPAGAARSTSPPASSPRACSARSFGQPLVIENRGGASGSDRREGSSPAAAPDGYTLLFAGNISSLVVTPGRQPATATTIRPGPSPPVAKT